MRIPSKLESPTTLSLSLSLPCHSTYTYIHVRYGDFIVRLGTCAYMYNNITFPCEHARSPAATRVNEAFAASSDSEHSNCGQTCDGALSTQYDNSLTSHALSWIFWSTSLCGGRRHIGNLYTTPVYRVVLYLYSRAKPYNSISMYMYMYIQNNQMLHRICSYY